VQAEVVLGITFTFTAGFFIWWLDVSLDGVEPPDISAILTSIVVQLFGLFITHLGDVLYSEVVMRRPMLLVVHRNFRGYDLFLCLLIFTMWAETSHGILGSTLGRVPRVDTTGDREPTWLFLTEDVVSALNVSAICAEFPSATVFARSGWGVDKALAFAAIFIRNRRAPGPVRRWSPSHDGVPCKKSGVPRGDWRA
jgi:hypothetical protein